MGVIFKTPEGAVEKTNKSSGVVTSQKTEAIPVAELPQDIPTLEGHNAEVSYSLSYTHNLGNFESLKVGVSVTLPSPADDIDTTFQKAVDWVNAKMEAEVESITGGAIPEQAKTENKNPPVPMAESSVTDEMESQEESAEGDYDDELPF